MKHLIALVVGVAIAVAGILVARWLAGRFPLRRGDGLH
jgi:hypothetical protein